MSLQLVLLFCTLVTTTHTDRPVSNCCDLCPLSAIPNKANSVPMSPTAREVRRALKVGAIADPPFIKPCFAHWPKNCSDPGFDFLFFKKLLEAIGFSVQKTKLFQNEKELLEKVEAGAIDVSGSPVFLDSIHSIAGLDLSPVISEDALVLFFRKRQVWSLSNNLLFSTWCWLVWLVLASLLLALTAVNFIAKLLGIVSHARKFPNMLWWMALGLLLSTYANFLAISLSIPPEPEKPFSNLQELSEKLLSGENTLVLTKTMLTYYIMNPRKKLRKVSMITDEETRKNMKLVFTRNRAKVVIDTEKVVAMVLQDECYVGAVWKSAFEKLKVYHCGLEMIPLPEFPAKPLVSVYKKRGEVGKRLNKLMLREAFMEQYESKYRKYLEKQAGHGHTLKCPRNTWKTV